MVPSLESMITGPLGSIEGTKACNRPYMRCKRIISSDLSVRSQIIDFKERDV